MRIPQTLEDFVEQELSSFDRRTLSLTVAELTRRYRDKNLSHSALKTAADRAAYLAARLPATFAAASRVFTEIRELAPHIEISSVLDLGSGPGTALWVASEVFPDLGRAMAVEADPAWIGIGRKLAASSTRAAIREAHWLQHDLRASCGWPRHDLVVISYALGELPVSAGELLIERAFQASGKFLAIIEPGTMRGFEVIHRVRAQLIASKIPILAPCPHRLACPMATAGDWCHFAQRVERTSTHRQMKRAQLAYEDEKFSYIIAARESPQVDDVARIVRHPQKRPGHVELNLCTSRGIERRTITRSQKTEYKRARRSEWGDLCPD